MNKSSFTIISNYQNHPVSLFTGSPKSVTAYISTKRWRMRGKTETETETEEQNLPVTEISITTGTY